MSPQLQPEATHRRTLFFKWSDFLRVWEDADWKAEHVFECCNMFREFLRLAKPTQGYLAHTKMPILLGTPWDPGHRPSVGS